ncbi:putative Mast/stem cell growth factor receptor Kit [Polypedilum vanderplanki]|uniref:Mast/stem cell growth factor receptor Kit n=1 Tax=Polypedilum vanderplanki TaxID=319348 RepID=A0A9J6C2T3_POLVA|nr:putative Mast/stem cell growth factor receptor Kit [Polypedilum vanderplanki]
MVAWLRVDTQTILTIQNNVITKNHRVGISFTEKKTWQLRLKDVRESDKGWYMCQINTDPMKSQMGYLDVVVPPDILDFPTSTDMIVREGNNVTLRCAATGSPAPTITWRREGGEKIMLANETEVLTIEGATLNIPRVNRLHMGSYLCIASNGVPPSVSKRITLIVHFPPMISVANQLVGAYEGQKIVLECHSEAFPRSINYFTKEKGEIVPQGGKFESTIQDNAYKVDMKLTIKSVSQSDFGSYTCVSKNSLGETDGTIKLYRLPHDDGNYLNWLEGRRRKGKKGKQKKGNSQIESNNVEDDPDGLNKRKELMVLNPDDVYDYSSSSQIVASHHPVILISILIASGMNFLLN